MKKILLVALLQLSIFSYSQRITYTEVSKSSEQIKGFFSEYESKDGSVYKVGDTLKIAKPLTGSIFTHIYQKTSFGITNLSVSYSGNNVIIEKIYSSGMKNSGFNTYFMTKRACGICYDYIINFELALENGEIKTLGLTSEEALKQLKTQKDKLDLELITKEEYEEKKQKLIKYIK